MNDLRLLVNNGVFMSFAQGRRAIAAGAVKIDGIEVVNFDSQMLTPGVHRVVVGRHVNAEITIPQPPEEV
jgi:hypothetical protein